MRKVTKWLVCVLTVVFAAAILTACGTPDADKLKTKLEKEGYTVQVMDSEVGEQYAGAEKALMAMKGDMTDVENLQVVAVIFFKDKESLKAAKELVEKAIPETIKDKSEIKTSGLAYIYGTKDAVKLV